MPCSTAYICFVVALFAYVSADIDTEGVYAEEEQPLVEMLMSAQNADPYGHIYAKRDMENSMPGVLRFGKRSFIDEVKQNGQKKEMPGVLRFGKRSSSMEKKSVPGVLRFGKRDEIPGVLRFGKRGDMPGVLRFGKRDMPGVLRFGKRSMPGVLRFGKRDEIPGVLSFDVDDNDADNSVLWAGESLYSSSNSSSSRIISTE